MLPADVHAAYCEHRELESCEYEDQAVDEEADSQAVLMQAPTLLPALASQYSDCAGQPLVTVPVGLDQAVERQDCFCVLVRRSLLRG